MTTKKLKDGTQYTKATHHNGKDLKGKWCISFKIDGVRIMRNHAGEVVSRNGKPLYNCSHLKFEDAELFRTDWNTSVSLVRSQQYKETFQSDVYELKNNGVLDSRLVLCEVSNPTNEMLENYLSEALARGYEGIVARQHGTTKWIKLVPELTADVVIIGYEMSEKRKGFIKNFKTKFGNVSATSFDVEQLQEIANDGADKYLGSMMEVGYRETTTAGKFRFAKFKRWREDKDEEGV